MDKVYATITVKVLITDKEDMETIIENAVERFDDKLNGMIIEWDYTVTDSK
jgi:hypothetical protein